MRPPPTDAIQPERARFDTVGLLLFIGCVILGSLNFVAIRFSNVELAPLWGAGLRFLLAAAIFAVIGLVLRPPLPGSRAMRDAVLFGLLNFGISFGLSYWALQHVTASAATLIWATVPMTTLVLAVLQRLDRFTPRALVGALLALAGIAWAALGPGTEPMPLLALVAMILCAFASGQSIIVGKRVAHLSPVTVNAIAMAAGAAVLMATSLAVGEEWRLPQQADTRLAVAYLVLSSLGLFALALLLIRRWSPSASSYVLVMFPVVTPLLESWLLQVPLTAAFALGVALVLLGVWFGALAPRRRHAPPARA